MRGRFMIDVLSLSLSLGGEQEGIEVLGYYR